MPRRKQKASILLPNRNTKAKRTDSSTHSNVANTQDKLAAGHATSGLSKHAQSLLRLQRKYGNHFVQKLLARADALRKSGKPIQPKLMVNRAGDQFEQEANQVARALVQRDERTGSSTADSGALHRQAEEKDKKTAQMKPEDEKKTVQTQPEEEKELAQTKAEDDKLHRQTAAEEKKKETPA